ncbi:MAG: hypothetical protein J7621_21850 [Niastella sp.]|nr:hypothetical protein [Niastella sp.]
MKRLLKGLQKAYKEYEENPYRRIGILNDEILAIVVARIRKEPSLDNFLMFTNCLNFFYSTRLQGAVDKDVFALKNVNKVIIRVAKELEAAWGENGLNLKAEQPSGPVNVKKVERLRRKLKKVLNERRAYSFCTKVFHQLNSQYPILDARINQFMYKEKFKPYRVNFYADHTPYKVFQTAFQDMMKDLGWPLDQVNELDNAIWVYFDKHLARYKSTKSK